MEKQPRCPKSCLCECHEPLLNVLAEHVIKGGPCPGKLPFGVFVNKWDNYECTTCHAVCSYLMAFEHKVGCPYHGDTEETPQ